MSDRVAGGGRIRKAGLDEILLYGRRSKVLKVFLSKATIPFGISSRFVYYISNYIIILMLFVPKGIGIILGTIPADNRDRSRPKSSIVARIYSCAERLDTHVAWHLAILLKIQPLYYCFFWCCV
jgi:hypothetical protein